MADGRTLQRIWIKPAHEKPMEERVEAQLVAGRGIEGDAQFRSRRPVTIMARERWARVQEALGASVDPGLRRANLLVQGVDLADSRDRVLRVGPVRLLIRGETKPCGLMDEQHTGLREALVPEWGGGAWAEVLTGGTIRPGDTVGWE